MLKIAGITIIVFSFVLMIVLLEICPKCPASFCLPWAISGLGIWILSCQNPDKGGRK